MFWCCKNVHGNLFPSYWGGITDLEEVFLEISSFSCSLFYTCSSGNLGLSQGHIGLLSRKAELSHAHLKDLVWWFSEFLSELESFAWLRQNLVHIESQNMVRKVMLSDMYLGQRSVGRRLNPHGLFPSASGLDIVWKPAFGSLLSSYGPQTFIEKSMIWALGILWL